MTERSKEIVAFWERVRRECGIDHDDYAVVSFGDGPEMADALLDLTLKGIKRATASLARAFTEDTVPCVGDVVVATDGAGRPRCVWRTTEVEVKPLNDVDDAFARDEGEGDRTVADWLDGHRRYFARQCARNGWPFADDISVVFERFEVIYRE